MRVLVTNTRNQQAYTIVAALRPHAERMAITVHGRNWLARSLAPPAASRFVDAAYPTPAPPRPWLRPDTTPAEEAYVRALLAICRRERIQVIIPSRDEVAYILSRHQARFLEIGTAVPVAGFEVQSRIMNKREMLRVAEAAGIPIPRTTVPATRAELDAFVDRIGLPVVLKPSFDSGGQGLRYVMRRDDLDRWWRPPASGQPDLLVQEYIPGPRPGHHLGVDLVMDRDGRCRAMFQHYPLRFGRWNVGGPCAATVSAAESAVAEQTLRLLRAFTWWGGACVEWKFDRRDGRFKLMEPNARIGATVWAACVAGVNVPLILAQTALGLAPAPVEYRQAGRVFVDPAIEALAAVTYAANRVSRTLLGRRAAPPPDFTPRLGPWLRDWWRSVFRQRRRMSDSWQTLSRDPVSQMLLWLELAVHVLRHGRTYVPHR